MISIKKREIVGKRKNKQTYNKYHRDYYHQYKKLKKDFPVIVEFNCLAKNFDKLFEE